jgi:hypothetical protein
MTDRILVRRGGGFRKFFYKRWTFRQKTCFGAPRHRQQNQSHAGNCSGYARVPEVGGQAAMATRRPHGPLPLTGTAFRITG